MFCRGVKKQFGNRVARVLLFCLIFGSGMHISAAGKICSVILVLDQWKDLGHVQPIKHVPRWGVLFEVSLPC